MRIVGNNPQLSRQTQATASGAITGGKPVVVNTDGTVSGAGGATNSAGTPVIFEADFDSSDHAGVTFDSNSNRIVIAYYDPENSNYGTAIVGTIDPSDNSISYGTPVVFNSGTSQYVTATFDSNSNKVVIAFRHQDGDGAGIVGTVDPSDNSISFGSSAKFSGGSFVTFTTITFDSTLNKIVIAYKRPNTNYGTCVIGTVSGTSISFGTPVVFNSAETQFIATTYDSSNQRVVIFYMDSGNSNYGTAIVGTVSGTGISFGSEVVFSSGIARGMSTVFDTNSNKVFVAWSSGIDDTIKSIIGTVSGTGISFGSAVQIDSNISDGYETGSAFDSNTNKVVVTYSDEGSSSKGTAIVGTVSGTSVSYETAFVFETGSTRICYTEGAVFDSNANRVLTIYVDVDNSNSGTSAVIQTSSTNLTSENFIGFAEDTVATGQPVTVNTKGAIADNMPSLPFTITYDSKSFDHSSQDVIAEEIRFKPDGTKFYLLTNDNDIIYQYAMSTAWDISTASYENKSFNVQSQEGTPQAMAINADGTSFYIAGQSRVVYQYNLTTAYDISTASYASKSFSLTTQISSGSGWSLDFDSTGTKMYALGSSGTAYQYTLSSAFDVSTASYASKSLDTTSQTSDSTSFAITSDGTSLYVVSSGSDQVFKYTLSTAFDLATASYSGISLTTTSQDNFPYGVAVKTDETKLYVTGAQNDSVYQYSLSDSLTIGQQYFVQTDGTLSETADSPSVIAGTAVAGSTLIVKG